MSRPSPKERASAFVRGARPSIAGQHGHDALFSVACGLVVGFGLSDGDAWELLTEYNLANCNPAWSEKDLRRKLTHARSKADKSPNEVGALLNQDRADYTGPKIQSNDPGSTPIRNDAPAPAPFGTPQSTAQSRTVRTPKFKVRKLGEGVKKRTVRTIRTVVAHTFINRSPVSPLTRVKETPSEPSENKQTPKPEPSPEPESKPVKRSRELLWGDTRTTIMRDGTVTREHSNGRIETRRSVENEE